MLPDSGLSLGIPAFRGSFGLCVSDLGPFCKRIQQKRMIMYETVIGLSFIGKIR